MTHGTLRAVYLQQARCATSSTGLTDAGDADSAACGAANPDDCQIEWLTVFNPFADEKFYSGSCAMAAEPLSGLTALAAAPKDWWIAVEATKDIASYALSVQLLAAPPPSSRRAPTASASTRSTRPSATPTACATPTPRRLGRRARGAGRRSAALAAGSALLLARTARSRGGGVGSRR